MTMPNSLPCAAGIGLKPAHYTSLLGQSEDGVLPAWVEIHPQNYFGDGGPPHRWLTAIAERFPVSFHSVGLSLGGAAGCDREELGQLARLADRHPPAAISDHLSWSGTGGAKYPDLLPIPYNGESLAHLAGEIGRVQDRLDRAILVENPSRYLAWRGDEMSEPEFIAALCARAGCGLLLDLNNVEVSAANLAFDAAAYVDAIDPALVGEIHVAGHAIERHGEDRLLIDDHGSPVSDVTWTLLDRFIERAGPRPVLVEWDTDVPSFARLMAEAKKADRILDAGRQARARAA